MKTGIIKKAGLALSALAMACTALFGNITTVKAETRTALCEIGETAVKAEGKCDFSFTLEERSDIDVSIFSDHPSEIRISVYNEADQPVDWVQNPYTVGSEEFELVDAGYYGYVDTISNVPAGDYRYELVFSEAANVMIGAYATQEPAKLSQTKAVITKGFSKTLFVSGETVKSWKSDNTDIASVNKKGKVIANQVGKTTVTAVLEDGRELSCAVSVKENNYAERKIVSEDVKANKCAMSAYSMKYDSKGNLIVKASCVNNTSHNVTGLEDFKIVVKKVNGKKIGTYSASQKKITVLANSVKRISFTIPAEDLAKKNINLRNASVEISGKYLYSE